jgi:hypothetical protein
MSKHIMVVVVQVGGVPCLTLVVGQVTGWVDQQVVLLFILGWVDRSMVRVGVEEDRIRLGLVVGVVEAVHLAS